MIPSDFCRFRRRSRQNKDEAGASFDGGHFPASGNLFTATKEFVDVASRPEKRALASAANASRAGKQIKEHEPKRRLGSRKMVLLRFHLQVIIHAVAGRASISSRDALSHWEAELFPPDLARINQSFVPPG